MPEGPGVGTYAKRAEGNTPEGADPFFFFSFSDHWLLCGWIGRRGRGGGGFVCNSLLSSLTWGIQKFIVTVE